MRRLVVLLLALLPLAMPSPASAKGATDVVVSGPGLEDVHLTYTRRGGDVDVMTLAEASGVYLVFGEGAASEPPPLSAAELGPRYRFEWRIGQTRLATSLVHPFAPGGGWAEIRGGTDHLQSGWVKVGPALATELVALGATDPRATYAAVLAAADVVAHGAWTLVHGRLPA